MTVRTGRAAPLPLEERRAALVEATLRAIKAHGAEVSTRQIAAEAGVAEGTIFRAFDDKESLLRAAVARAFSPDDTIAAIEAVDPTLHLRERLVRVVDLLEQRLRGQFHLIVAMRFAMPRGREHDATHQARERALNAAITAVIAPDADLLTRPPAELTHLVRVLVFAVTHPAVTADVPLGSADLVSVLLDGVLDRTSTPTREATPC